MARSAVSPKPTYPPIPGELRALINEQGYYYRGGFVPGQDDLGWRRYQVLRNAWCQDANLKITDFRAAAVKVMK